MEGKMKKLVFYRCSVCGNVAVKLVDSGVPMVCCGRPMNEIKANTTDAIQEKHVPVVEVKGKVVNVKIGSVPHPMTEEHFIQFVAMKTNQNVYIKKLKPNEKPECEFALLKNEKVEEVFAYCNLHSLWKA